MTEIKISYNNEEYTLEELLQKLSSSEEKIKELQSKVNAYAMADAINTIHKKSLEEYDKIIIKQSLNKYYYDTYKEVADDLNQERIKESKQTIDFLKENNSLREENIRLKEQIDKLEEEKSAIAWMGVILALMKTNNKQIGDK